MNEERELSQLEAKVDEAIAYIKGLRQDNEKLKAVISEKDKKIEDLTKTLRQVEERVQQLIAQLPAEKQE